VIVGFLCDVASCCVHTGLRRNPVCSTVGLECSFLEVFFEWM
jgi:hypothetical protein